MISKLHFEFFLDHHFISHLLSSSNFFPIYLWFQAYQGIISMHEASVLIEMENFSKTRNTTMTRQSCCWSGSRSARARTSTPPATATTSSSSWRTAVSFASESYTRKWSSNIAGAKVSCITLHCVSETKFYWSITIKNKVYEKRTLSEIYFSSMQSLTIVSP